MASSLRVSSVADPGGFDGLREAWERLCDRGSDISVFQTFDWQATWWKHYGDGSPYILLAHAGAELVAILPLYRSNVRLPLTRPMTRIRFIGVGGDTSPDYLGQIALAEYAEDAAVAFTAHLAAREPEWDLLELTDLPERSPLLTATRAPATAPRGRISVVEAARISFARLPASWEAYLAERTSNARQSIRARTRKLLALPSSRIFLWTDPDRLDAAVDRLIELHGKRWQGRAEEYSFSSDRYNAFHRELMHRFMERGWLRLYCVEVAGDLLGIYYFYAYRGTLYYFQGGFDPAHEKLALGQCLFAFAIESGIAEGCVCLDMLRGDYEYKRRWAPEVRRTYSTRISMLTAPTLVNDFMRRVANPVRARLRRAFAGRARQ